MAPTKNRTIKSSLVLFMFSLMAIGLIAFCIFIIGGKVANMVEAVLWIYLIYKIINAISSITNAKQIAYKIGATINTVNKENIKEPRLNGYDIYLNAYEKRPSSLEMWLSLILILAWVNLMLLAGFEALVYVYMVLIFLDEIAKYKIYSCIRKNKVVWEVSAFAANLQNFLISNLKDQENKKEEED